MLKNDIQLLYHIKINSKWIKNLNVRAKATKLFEENVGEKFQEIRLCSDLLDMTPKAQAAKVKRDKLDYINIYNFCTSKDTINRV